MKQALEALEDVQEMMNTSQWFNDRVTALRQAIEQAEKQQVELDRMHEVYYELVEALHQINSIFNYRHRHRVYFVRRLALAMGINQAVYSYGDRMNAQPKALRMAAVLEAFQAQWDKEHTEELIRLRQTESGVGGGVGRIGRGVL